MFTCENGFVFVIVVVVRHAENLSLIRRQKNRSGLDRSGRGRSGSGRVPASVGHVVVLDLAKAAGAVVDVAGNFQKNLENFCFYLQYVFSEESTYEVNRKIFFESFEMKARG